MLTDPGWSKGGRARSRAGGHWSAASRPSTLGTVTSEHMTQHTCSALTVQPTSGDSPHSAAERPSHQQGSPRAAGRAPLLKKASSGGPDSTAPTPQAPSSADTCFLTKISLGPTLLLPEPRALILAQLPSHTSLPGPHLPSSQSRACDKPQARRPDVS